MSFRDHMDDGAPDFSTLWSKRPKASRDHICDLCGRVIPKGSVYHSAGHLVDGKFEYVRAHDGHGLCVIANEAPDPFSAEQSEQAPLSAPASVVRA